jgi:hypothetical protein
VGFILHRRIIGTDVAPVVACAEDLLAECGECGILFEVVSEFERLAELRAKLGRSGMGRN